LRDQDVLWATIDRPALIELGAEPAIQLALEAPRGYTFSSRSDGQFIEEIRSPGGTHGYLPFRQGMDASFIAWGPRIKPGLKLRRISMTAIGPTILKDLGVNNPQFGAEAPLTEIFK
jgi:hypothetical protein